MADRWTADRCTDHRICAYRLFCFARRISSDSDAGGRGSSRADVCLCHRLHTHRSIPDAQRTITRHSISPAYGRSRRKFRLCHPSVARTRPPRRCNLHRIDCRWSNLLRTRRRLSDASIVVSIATGRNRRKLSRNDGDTRAFLSHLRSDPRRAADCRHVFQSNQTSQT